jgi:hypothetical protein
MASETADEVIGETANGGTSETRRYDVLIVGGGPAGLACWACGG